MMNIGFVSNFSKTVLFRKIADDLVEKNTNIKVFWIFTDCHLTYLANDDEFILVDKKYLNKESDKLSDFRLNELVYGDRVLSTNFKEGITYLNNIQKPLYDFVQENNISYIFGERTWAHELLLSRICQQFVELNCKYISFGTVRIPSNRTAFFLDENETILFKMNDLNNTSEFHLGKPEYLSINNKIIRKQSSLMGRLSRIGRFISKTNINPMNPTVLNSFTKRFRFGFFEEYNRIMYRAVKREDFKKYRDKKYIFYGLHKQPEKSIDVLGRYYDDQYVNIKNLWRLLPDDWYLIIKEHTNAIGDRNINFYSRIIKLPRVVLINEHTDSKDVIQNSEIVFSVTGTISLEAALYNKKSVTLAPVFFNNINTVLNLSWKDISNYRSITEIPFPVVNNIEKYKKYLLDHSFIANSVDPLTDDRVLKRENIHLISKAFLYLMGL